MDAAQADKIRENTNGMRFSKILAGATQKACRKRISISEHIPVYMILSLCPKGSFFLIQIKSKRTAVKQIPVTRKVMPLTRRINGGIPRVVIHSASPPGVSKPRENVTPSWIRATGPHSNSGNSIGRLRFQRRKKLANARAR